MKPRSTRRLGGPAPATGRRTARPGQQEEYYEDERPLPAPPPPNKTPLYVGVGVGGAVLLIVIGVAMSGGESGGGSSGSTARSISKAMSEASSAYNAGRYREALSALEPILSDARYRKSSRYRDVENLAGRCREQLNRDQVAAGKVSEFKARIEKAKSDGTMMQKASEFKRECEGLKNEYRMTTSGDTLLGLYEDIMRCVNTNSQGEWTTAYNPEKARIEKVFLSAGNYAEAIRAWKQFNEINTQDPVLKSRVDQEVLTINQQAVAAAEKIVAEAGGGADARSKLEDAQRNFMGTEGNSVILKAMRSLK